MSNQNSVSGAGQGKIALNKNYKASNATSHNILASVAKSNDEEPPYW